jgi:hypothetical protein
MNLDMAQFEELDRSILLEVNGGYYGIQNIYVPDSYVRKHATNYKKTKGSTYGYTSAGGGQASSTPVIPVAYLVPTADGHEYAANPEPEEVEPVEVAPETPGMGGPLTELNDLGVNTGLKIAVFHRS